jgi:hypothetical protein
MAWKHLRPPLSLAFLVFATAALDYMDIDEFECEQAVAHLGECCPLLDLESIDCDTGICNPADIDREESECIQELDCAAIASKGLCNQAAFAATSTTTSGSTEEVRLCP